MCNRRDPAAELMARPDYSGPGLLGLARARPPAAAALQELAQTRPEGRPPDRLGWS